MPQASQKDRKLRKVKRERTLAFRVAEALQSQRDQARMVAVGLEAELKKYIAAFGKLPEPTPVQPKRRSVADQLAADADFDPTETMISVNEAKSE